MAGEERRKHLWDARRPVETNLNLRKHRKDSTIFVHILSSSNGRLELSDLPARVVSAALITGGKVDFLQSSGKLVLTVPSSSLDSMDTVVRLEH